MSLLPSIPPLLITLLLFARLPHAISLTHQVSDNELNYDCAFGVAGYEFDFCSLVPGTRVQGVQSFVVGEGPAMKVSPGSTMSYEVTLPGRRQTGVSGRATSARLCPVDTWICMIEATSTTGTRSSAPEPGRSTVIASEQGTLAKIKVDKAVIASSQGSIGDLPPDEHNPTFTVVLSAKRRNGTGARIKFQCDRTKESLSFVGERDGEHIFRWRTRHGCPLRSSLQENGHPIRISQSEEGVDDTEPTDENKEEDALTPEKPGMHMSRRWIAGILLFVGLAVVCTSILASSIRARHYVLEKLYSASHTLMPTLSRAGTVLRPLQKALITVTPSVLYQFRPTFRQGDSQLVQWAQEEMSLEEDLMVNGSGAYRGYDQDADGWNPDGLDEYIPLTISPKWGRRVRSYGTADTPTPTREEFGGVGRIFWR